AALRATTERIVATGAIGVNFEDGIAGGEGMYGIEEQAARIKAVREATELPLFINARTDLFLRSDRAAHAGLLEEALVRARAYSDAGASGLFVPGLVAEELVARLCEASPLPVNIMMMDGAPSTARLAEL